MTRIMAVWTLSLLLLSGVASADPEPWMVKENPNELSVLLDSDSDCPSSRDVYYDSIDSVLVRSRIRLANRHLLADEIGLSVEIACNEPSDASSDRYYIYLAIRFASLDEPEIMLYGDPSYIIFGVTDAMGIQDALRRQTERAITDYLQANFDL